MIRMVTLILLLGIWSVAVAQSEPPKRAVEIRAALEKVRVTGEVSVNGVLLDMRTFDGKLTHVNEETFTVYSKKKSGPQRLMTIKYIQVLELNGDGISISYFPDPDVSPFADWTAVKKLTYGDRLEIDQLTGKNIVGVLLRVSDNGVEVIDGNRTIQINKDDVIRIFLARLEQHSVVKAIKGAGKGVSSVGRGSGSSQIGAAAVEGAVRTGAAAAGAIGAVARRVPNDRLLIYAK